MYLVITLPADALPLDSARRSASLELVTHLGMFCHVSLAIVIFNYFSVIKQIDGLAQNCSNQSSK